MGKEKRPLLILLILLALVLAGGIWWLEEVKKGPSAPQKPGEEGGSPQEDEAVSPSPPAPLPEGQQEATEPKPSRGSPRIAIIIDDLGYNGQNYRPFLDIRYPLTFAVLPSLPYSKRIAREATGRGREVLLHLPLEPHDYPSRDPGRGLISSSMDEEEMRQVFEEDLRSVPGAVGVNNHMGSRMMEDPEAMKILLRELKRRNLYFVDSLTTNRTAAPALAREMGIKCGRRKVFLDNYQDRSYIESQLQALTESARSKGGAIGVGHPYAITAAVLREQLPRLEQEGIRLVPASQLVR